MTSVFDAHAALAVDTLFGQFGVAAEYYPKAGAPALDVTVIRRRAEVAGELAGGRFTMGATAQAGAWVIDVRRDEVAAPQKGDAFVLDDAAYEIAEQPALDGGKLVWRCPLKGD